MNLSNKRVKEMFLVFLIKELEKLIKKNLFGFSINKRNKQLVTRNKTKDTQRDNEHTNIL